LGCFPAVLSYGLDTLIHFKSVLLAAVRAIHHPPVSQDPQIMASTNSHGSKRNAAFASDLHDPKAGYPSGQRLQAGIVDLTNDSDDEMVSAAPISKDGVGAESDYKEDEDLKKAIELSLQATTSLSPQPLRSTTTEASRNLDTRNPSEETSSNLASRNACGILGFDRKKQEQERLARVAKRKAERSPPPASKERKLATPGLPRKNDSFRSLALQASKSKPLSSQPNIQNRQQVNAIQKPSERETPNPTPSIQFPRGVVKKTWVLRQARKGDDIKIEEVLQRSDLELAILSAFQWDMEWLFSKLDTSRTRLLLVMQAKDESTVSLILHLHHSSYGNPSRV
jgi:Tyrosyl-DNA phosphodiesterase